MLAPLLTMAHCAVIDHGMQEISALRNTQAVFVVALTDDWP